MAAGLGPAELGEKGASAIRRWLVEAPQALGAAGRWALAAAVLGAVMAATALGLRWWATRRSLHQRVAYAVLPADSFDPSAEEVLRVAGQLTKTRRAVLGFLDRPATAVRVELASAGEGRMAYVLGGPAKAKSILRSVRFDGVDIRPADGCGRPGDPGHPLGADPPGDGQGGSGQAPACEPSASAGDGDGEVDPAPRNPVPRRRQYRSRAELVLALPDQHPLREVPLRPDPLAAFARAFDELRDDLGDAAAVAIDLMPITPAARRRRTRSAIAEERRAEGGAGAGVWAQVLEGLGYRAHTRPRSGRSRPSSGSLEWAERRQKRLAVSHKVVGYQPAFALQVLVRASSEIKGRPQALVQSLVDCFRIFDGDNYLRVAGRRLGPWFLGADAVLQRRRFDRRFDTGRFGPRRQRFVTVGEIAGLLKPPSLHCRPLNVIRSGGLIPPPPRGLPEFRFQPGVLPLGVVQGPDGDRRVGVYLKDTFFSYMSGKSRYGKSETGINQLIHVARSGEGCFFLDPHADAIARIKPYLTDHAERIVEINVAAGSHHRQAAWNLFSMEGLGPEDLEAKQSAIVSSFASAMHWDSGTNTRALNLTTMASKTLLELALVLPPEIAPTIFQMATLLSNEDWREVVLPHVSAHSRDFWLHRWPKQTGGDSASSPVTNAIDMLRSSPSVAALLGASRSTYDVRRCMDEGLIVLASPAGADDKDRLVANFLVYDVLRAALSRKDTLPERRRRFFAWFDEVTSYDGASKGNLARLLEQVGKYNVVASLLNQNPRRLTEATREAVFMNSSHLAATVLDADAAALVTKQWGGAVEPSTIERLERFTYVASVTLGREISRPFLVRGLEVSDLWAEHYDPSGVEAMDGVIHDRRGHRPVAETLAHLDRLDEEIAAYLSSAGAPARLHLVGSPGEGPPARPRADHVRWSALDT